jgi:arylsulfatase A-like enzyme/Flp pilus assembly protein TadD
MDAMLAPRTLLLVVGLTFVPSLAHAQPARPPNLVLVTIDTLRADRVGAYGHPGASTPALDRLAREGLMLTDAIVAAPMTRPSHATLFTGRHPWEHAIRDNAHGPLEPRWPTIATQLRAAGYDTAAFVGAYPVSRPSGLDRGFQFYDDPFSGSAASREREPRSERRGSEVGDAALAWLDARATNRPFFMWVHLFDPHAPYESPEPFGSRFARSPYDGEVAYADHQLGRLLGRLDALGLARSTLVVATSDHGEGLGEHGEGEHMLLVYDSTLKVPLLMRLPGMLPAAARIQGQFRAVDLLPTLLDLLGRPPIPTSGASRAAELRAARALPENSAYAESLYGQLHFGWAPLRALRGEGFKYIAGPDPELYALREDPGETRNRIGDRAAVAAGMARALAAHGAGARTQASGAPDTAATERLAALGYVAGGGFQGTPSGDDPRRHVVAFSAQQRESREAIRLYKSGQLEAAIAILRRLDRLPLPSFNVSFYLGRALVDGRRPAEAVAPLEKAVEMLPTYGLPWAYLVEALRGSGQGPAARRALESGLAANPRHPALSLLRGRLALEAGDFATAGTALEAAREADPADPAILVALSDLARARGDVRSALDEAQAATRADATSAPARVALALALGAAGREADAARELRTALDHDPDQSDALFFLAAIERRAGRSAMALPLLERLAQATPDYPGLAPALENVRAELAPPTGGLLRLRLIRVGDRGVAEETLRRITSGADFAGLARSLSQDPSAAAGGALGDVAPADLAEPLRSAAIELAPGGTSAPLAVPGGWVLLHRER